MKVTLHNVQLAIEFIESNLLDEFRLSDVAQAARLNVYTMHRLFTAVFGDSLKSYVRKRRLTVAAEQIRTSEIRIIELAAMCGFGSQAAFTRAFQTMFGVPPGRYRKNPHVTWHPGLQRPKLETMQHLQQVERTPRYEIFAGGIEICGPAMAIDIEGQEKIFDIWAELLPSLKVDHGKEQLLYGIGLAKHSQVPMGSESSLVYIAGTPFPQNSLEDGWVTLTIPRGNYAVFTHYGPLERIEDTMSYIWSTWLPKTESEKSDRPDFERLPLSAFTADVPRVEIWIAVE